MIKNNLKGVSLITLIITIIIIIILATTAIMAISNSNITKRASEATFKTDISTFREELDMYIANCYLNDYAFKPINLNASGDDLKTIIPSMKNKYLDVFEIENGKLVIKNDADENYIRWAREIRNRRKIR